MPNPQPNTWTQMPTHLSRLVLLSFIYYPLEDRIQQIYQQKYPQDAHTPPPHLPVLECWWGEGSELARRTPELLWLCPSLSQNTSVGLVDYQWDLNFSSWALNPPLSTSNSPHPSFHLHLTLWYLLQPRKSAPAYLNKPQAFLLDLRVH